MNFVSLSGLIKSLLSCSPGLLALAVVAPLQGGEPQTPSPPPAPHWEVGLQIIEPIGDSVSTTYHPSRLQLEGGDRAWGLRAGYVAGAYLGGDLVAHVDLQPRWKANLASQSGFGAFAGSSEFVGEEAGLGLLWNWKYFGFGPEWRHGRYRALEAGQEVQRVNLDRLYWRFSFGYLSPPSPLRMTVRFEARTTSVPQTEQLQNTNELLKGLAPYRTWELYAGVRF